MAYPYKITYDNTMLRGREDPRPWNLTDIILNLAGLNKNLLDIGCGTAKKWEPLAPHFKEIIGVDPNRAMLEQANTRLLSKKIDNFRLQEAYANRLPIENASIDVVSAMVSAYEVKEICRVLKPGGYVVIEDLGEMDKAAFKQYFYDQNHQPRGQLSYLPTGAIMQLLPSIFGTLFTDIKTIEGTWNAYFTKEELIALLVNTPTIKDFSLEQDALLLEQAISNLETEQGICLTHHRVLLVARRL